VTMAHAPKEAALVDAQDLAEILLDAEVKLGQMLEKISKVPKREPSRIGDKSLRGSEKTLPKGITKRQSHEAQEIARHPELVEEVKRKAREEGEIATAGGVRREIQKRHPHKREPVFEREGRELWQRQAIL
jgi:hypothetical protein